MNRYTPRSMGQSTALAPAPMPSLNELTRVQTDTASLAVNPELNFDIVMPSGMDAKILPPQVKTDIYEEVKLTSIESLTLSDISNLAAEPQKELLKALGGFMDRINQAENPQIFQLVNKLSTAVKEEDLPGLANKILNAQPSFGQRLLGKLSAKSLANSSNAVFEQLQATVSGKSKKLQTVLDDMEKKVEVEKQKAISEVESLEGQIKVYRSHFGEFVAATVFLNTFLAKAKKELEHIATPAYQGPMTLQEAQDKVQALESRALAVETAMTSLPAEQLIVRQVQTAAIQTVQEINTSMALRFTKIKMRLLSMHGGMMVKNLQRVDKVTADLDANLNAAGAILHKQIVTTAANAPGDNRKRDAEMIVALTQEIHETEEILAQARIDNQVKFDAARAMLAQSRTELTQLGAVIRPDRALQQ